MTVGNMIKLLSCYDKDLDVNFSAVLRTNADYPIQQSFIIGKVELETVGEPTLDFRLEEYFDD